MYKDCELRQIHQYNNVMKYSNPIVRVVAANRRSLSLTKNIQCRISLVISIIFQFKNIF